MKKHIENSGKRMGSVDNHSVPTSLKRAKTFLQDKYLKDIKANDDKNYVFKCKCYHSYKKNMKLFILYKLPFALYLHK